MKEKERNKEIRTWQFEESFLNSSMIGSKNVESYYHDQKSESKQAVKGKSPPYTHIHKPPQIPQKSKNRHINFQ